MTDQSDTGTQEARVHSHDGPIRHKKHGYILTWPKRKPWLVSFMSSFLVRCFTVSMAASNISSFICVWSCACFTKMSCFTATRILVLNILMREGSTGWDGLCASSASWTSASRSTNPRLSPRREVPFEEEEMLCKVFSRAMLIDLLRDRRNTGVVGRGREVSSSSSGGVGRLRA
eukprot:235195-Prorocentrum_minimum.AAC.1